LNYEVHIVPSVEKEMDKLADLIHARISSKILTLENNPRPRGYKKLSGKEEYRIRAGDYRVLYAVNDKDHIVTILAVGHRRDVYR
jgi:mRNA interferase RelE/StbE